MNTQWVTANPVTSERSQVEPVLADVAHTDLKDASLARTRWHEECEAAVNEQIKCARHMRLPFASSRANTCTLMLPTVARNMRAARCIKYV